MPKQSEKKKYLGVNPPENWRTYFDEALAKPEIRKQVEMDKFSLTVSGFGSWIIYRFLIDHTTFKFEHLNTYEDHATIMNRKTKQIINVYPREDGSLWCEECDSTDCEHVKFALSVPKIVEPLKKRGWKPDEK